MFCSSRQPGDRRLQRLGVGDFRQFDHHGVEIVVLVVVMAVMMRGAGVQIILGGGIQPEDDGGVDAALLHRQDRQRARGFGFDHRFRGGKARLTGQIGLRQEHDIGAGNLVLEHFRQRRFMVDRVIRFALGLNRVDIGREAAGGHGLGIGQSDDAIDRDARADCGPVEGLQKRLRQSQARGLDQDMVGALGQGHQRLDRRDEIIGDGAADAAIGQFDDVLGRAILIRAGFQDIAIDAHGAEFVDQHRQPLALRVLHQMADQRRLARAEKAGDDGDGDLVEVGHSDVSIGGIRARLCLRKITGRSRHGTMPSDVAA